MDKLDNLGNTNFDGYEPPVNILQDVMNEIRMQVDNDILKVVCKVGIDVNKDELIKALKYDRDQYRIGYENGLRDAAEVTIKTIAPYLNNNFSRCNICERRRWSQECVDSPCPDWGEYLMHVYEEAKK